jgi:LmbE family N-acetylglucosaminyl deacetylase
MEPRPTCSLDLINSFMKFRLALFILLLLHCLNLRGFSQSQELALDRGATGMAQALGRLPLTSRILFIAAHPDDETAGVLTYFSRGLHADTALLTLTRGEGGQNLISSDLFDALGLLRTGELLAADEYYGVKQYFTRAFDFGFSKSSEETLQKWNRILVLSDMVRAIRGFRPDVIVSVWQGNSKDGHGHHQASGILAREAYRLAGDAGQFPELAKQGVLPWQARKFYIGNLQPNDPASLTINAGQYAALFGASFQQIGAQGYSLHRSQGYGNSYAAPGTHPVRYRLIDPADQPDAAFFDRLDVTLGGLIQRLGVSWNLQPPWIKEQAAVLETCIQQARDRFSPSDFSGMIEPLVRGLVVLRQIREKIADGGKGSQTQDALRFLLAAKEQDFRKALDLATGLSFEALADDALVTPGQTFSVTVALTNRSSITIRPRQIHLQPAGGSQEWKIERIGELPETLKASERVEIRFKVSLPSEVPPTQPHWKRNSKSDTMYSISEQNLINRPLPHAALMAKLDYSVRAGTSTTTGPESGDATKNLDLHRDQAVEFLDMDARRGTHRIPILIAPELSINLTPAAQVVPLKSSSQPRWIRVEVTNNSASSAEGNLVLKPPSGWTVEPAQQPFSISRENEAAVLRFAVKSVGSAPPGKTSFEAVARLKGKNFNLVYQIISVMDLWRNLLYRRAETEVTTLDVQTPSQLFVGYIMGAGDKVPETLSQLGAQVKLLEADDLVSGDLSLFSCLVAGVRAYDVRRDLIANNSRVLDYVKNGGVYIVQYNTPAAWNKAQYAPYAAKIQNASHRVTDETAPVKILEPNHRLFNFPNRITSKDFDGWVQERGLYFIQERDPHFKALLSSHDPGDPPLDGGLLVAPYGKGLYVLTSYSWFRQLPEGVPGAIRIFANLISLGAPQQ